MKANNILQTIGNTPHVKINNIFPENINVWLKLENNNPGSSIKDRIALAMIEDAEAKGLLKAGGTIIEPTSGNTGIGLAMVAAVKNYNLILVMPESMSIERRRIMSAFGASFVLTPYNKGMKGAINKANKLLKEIPGAWMPMQFENKSNIEIHKRTTAMEIINDFPEGFDFFIAGVGTGGHIAGVSQILKKCFPKLKVYAVEPEDSPVLSGKEPGLHSIQGIGAGFVPDILNKDIIDRIITVSKENAFKYTTELTKNEGILCGISSGASLAAIAEVINEIPDGSKILSFIYDTGERYFSVDGLF